MTIITPGRLAAIALVCLTVVTGIAVWPQLKEHEQDRVDIENIALGVSTSPLELRLYQTASPDDQERSQIVTSKGQRTSFNSYHDGTTEDVHLYPDDWHRTASEEYFRTQPDGSRQLHSQAIFDPLSGEPGHETYISHSVYQVTGLLERYGHRLRDGRYQQTYYFEDGITPWRDRYFDSSLNFFTETIYEWRTDHHTGTYVSARLVRGDTQGEIWVSLYRQDGSRMATIKEWPGREEGTLFAPDGTTLLAEWTHDIARGQSSSYATYADGSKEPTTIWSSSWGRTKVLVYDAQTGRLVVAQEWKERPDSSAVEGKRYLLMSTTVMAGAGYPIDHMNHYMLYKVDMSDDGQQPTKVTISGQDYDTVKWLGDSGKRVIKTETETSSALHMPARSRPKSTSGELIDIDPALLTMPQRPDLPTFDYDGPPRLYDYK
jgi:hypothetical protein